MAHRLAPGAEVELDEIWFWTAKESGCIDIADRLIDSITERFFDCRCCPPHRAVVVNASKSLRKHDS